MSPITRFAGFQPQHVVRHVSGARRGAERDAAVRQQLAQLGACRVAEDPQRLALGRDQGDARAGDAARLGRRHDRQLVGGKRPRRPGRHHHDDVAAIAPSHLGERPLHRRHVDRPAERERAGKRGLGPRAHRDQQMVVRPPGARCEPRRVRGGVDGEQLVLDQLHVVATGEPLEVERRRGAEPERRRNGRRPVLQRMLRSQEVDLEVATGEVTQRQHRLHGGHARAGNQDTMHDANRRAPPRPAHPRPTVAFVRGTTERSRSRADR